MYPSLLNQSQRLARPLLKAEMIDIGNRPTYNSQLIRLYSFLQ